MIPALRDHLAIQTEPLRLRITNYKDLPDAWGKDLVVVAVTVEDNVYADLAALSTPEDKKIVEQVLSGKLVEAVFQNVDGFVTILGAEIVGG